MLDADTRPAPATTRRPAAVLTWLVPVGLAGALLLPALGRGYLWRDEFATREFASLPISDLVRAVDHVDYVLLPYYAVMHLVRVAGLDGTGLRVPSVLAALLAVTGLAVLADRWWGRAAGLAAGVALALNPLFVQLALEARPYSIAILFVVVSTLFLDLALREPGRWGPWVGYTAFLALAGLAHPYAAFAATAHLALTIGRNRSVLARHVVSLAVAAVVVAPIVLRARQQTEQISWIAPADAKRAILVLANVVSYGPGQRLTGASVGSAVAFAVAVVICLAPIGRRVWDRRPLLSEDRPLLCAIGFVVLPWLALLAISIVVVPTLTTHYLGPGTLGVALVFGRAVSAVSTRAGSGRLRRRWAAGSAIVLVVGAASYGYSAVTLTQGTVWQDNFRDLGRSLSVQAASGDVLAVVQRFDQGGVAAGVAYYLHDGSFQRELRSRLIGGDQPVVDFRTVVTTKPWRTEPMPTSARGPERIWLVNSSASPLPADVSSALDAHGCPPHSRPATAFGTVYLREVDCGTG